jgi:hypothetical protein
VSCVCISHLRRCRSRCFHFSETRAFAGKNNELNLRRGGVPTASHRSVDPSRIIAELIEIDVSSARAGGAMRMFEASFAPLSNADNAHCACASRIDARTIRNVAT